MVQIKEDTMRNMILEVLSMERKNLRSKAKTDQSMAEELSRTIIRFAKMESQI